MQPSSDPAARRPAVYRQDGLPHVKRIIAVGSGKGGVGKSTVTVNLAHALAARGLAVGLLDADLYGPSIPRMLALETRLKPEFTDGAMVPPVAYGIKAMSLALLMDDQAAILRAPMITKALTQMLRQTRWGTAEAPLDILLVDLPPGTGDVHLSLAQSVPLDGAILVTTPQDVAVADAEKSAVMFQKLDIPILGVIENMSYFTDPSGTQHRLFGEGGGVSLAKQFGTHLLAQLPIDPNLRECADQGQNFQEKYTDSEACRMYQQIDRRFGIVHIDGKLFILNGSRDVL